MTSVPAVQDHVDPRALDLTRVGNLRGHKRRGWLVRRALLAADIVGLLVAFMVTEAILGNQTGSADEIGQTTEYALFVVALPVWVVAAKLYGLYDRDEERTNHSTADDFAGVFQLGTITIWLVRVAAFAFGFGRPDFRKLLVFWLLAIACVSLARAAGRAWCRRRIEYIQNTLIVGEGALARALVERIDRHPEYGLHVVGFISTSGDVPVSHDSRATLGGVQDLPKVASLFDVERVIVATDEHDDPAFIRQLNDMGVQVDLIPRFHEVIGSEVEIHMVEGIPVIGLPAFDLSRSSHALKRCFDIVGSLVGLIVFAPVMAGAAAAIKLDSRGPIFFRQVRMGAQTRTFRIVKFRTMYDGADGGKNELAHLNKHVDGGDRVMFKINHDPRTTRVGRFLRRTSIDELPQLWNVLRGEMSLVGPRPLILEEHAHVRDWEAKRLGLRPGMTGLWQVLGRDNIPFDEMVKLDYLYVTSWSLPGDVRLILRTVPVLVRSRAALT